MATIRSNPAVVRFRNTVPKVKDTIRFCNKDNAYSDQYGALDVACAYASILKPNLPFAAIWHHGCIPPWTPEPAHLCGFTDKPGSLPLLVARTDQADRVMEAYGFRPRVLGMPILYCPDRFVPRLPGSLLLMPAHSLAGCELNLGNYASYIELHKPFLKNFSFVACALHYSCYSRSEIRSLFEASGIPVFLGASQADENSLKRTRFLFKSFEHISTNSFGSHIPYALFYGCRVSVFAHEALPRPDVRPIIQAYGSKEYMRLLGNTSWETSEASFLSRFKSPPGHGIHDAQEGQWWLGAENKLSPREMRDLLTSIYKTSFRTALVSHFRTGGKYRAFAQNLRRRLSAPFR